MMSRNDFWAYHSDRPDKLRLYNIIILSPKQFSRFFNVDFPSSSQGLYFFLKMISTE